MISTLNGIWWLVFLFVIPLQIATLAIVAALGNIMVRSLRDEDEEEEEEA